MLPVRFAAIVRKELIEVRRGVGWSWAIGLVATPAILGGIIFNFMTVFRSRPVPPGVNGLAVLGATVTLSLLLLGPLTVPTWTNTALGRVHFRDQSSGALVPILCTGIPPGAVWLGRLVAAFCAGHAMFLLGLAATAVLIRFWFHAPTVWSLSLWAAILISSPLASLCVPGFSYLLSWISKTAANTAAFIPMLIMLGAWLVTIHPPAMTLNPVAGVHIAGAVSLLLTAAMALAANRIQRGRIAGLQ